MTNPRKKDLSSIYPRQKSYSEIEAERKSIMLQRRPRHAAAKISLWTTLFLVVAVVTYVLISNIITSNLDSGGGVIFGVSVSILLLTIALGVMYYVCSLIAGVAQKLLANPVILYVILIIIAGIICLMIDVMTGAELLNVLTITGLMFLNAISVYIVARVMVKS